MFHGIKTNLLATGSRPIGAFTTAVIGLVATGVIAVYLFQMRRRREA